MKTEDLGNLRILNLIFKPAGMMMESRLRHWIFNPVETLQGADIHPGQIVLEVGSGTGFFSIPAAQMIGDKGCLIAVEPLSDYAKRIKQKVQDAGLQNVLVMQRDALDTGLNAGSMDKVLLFGVIPFPSLPLNRLLPEMHRVLKPEGTMAVWLFPPVVFFKVPGIIVRSGLFSFTNKQNSVYNYRRCEAE